MFGLRAMWTVPIGETISRSLPSPMSQHMWREVEMPIVLQVWYKSVARKKNGCVCIYNGDDLWRRE